MKLYCAVISGNNTTFTVNAPMIFTANNQYEAEGYAFNKARERYPDYLNHNVNVMEVTKDNFLSFCLDILTKDDIKSLDEVKSFMERYTE